MRSISHSQKPWQAEIAYMHVFMIMMMMETESKLRAKRYTFSSNPCRPDVPKPNRAGCICMEAWTDHLPEAFLFWSLRGLLLLLLRGEPGLVQHEIYTFEYVLIT